MSVVSKVVQSDSPGTNKAFFRNQTFVPGDVPSNITSSVAGVYCKPTSRYPDGSVEYAEISGAVDTTSGPVTIPLNLTTTADIAPTFPATTASIQLVGLGTATFSATADGTMRAFVGSTAIEAFCKFQAYANGDVRIEPWVEATSIAIPFNTKFSYQMVVKIGTTTVFDSVTPIDIFMGATDSLLGGQAFEGYFKNGDPGVFVVEDVEYFRKCPQVAIDYIGRGTFDSTYVAASNPGDPYYDNGDGGGVPVTSLIPGSNANLRTNTESDGFSWAIGPEHTGWAQFIASSGSRSAFKIAVANDHAMGTHSTFFSDPATGEAISLTDHPTIGAGSWGSGTDVNPRIMDIQHTLPSPLMTFLITGSEWARRATQMMAAGFQMFNDYRQGALGVMDDGHAPEVRGGAWGTRNVMKGAHAAFGGSTLRTEFTRQCQNIVDFNYDSYIVGSGAPISDTDPDRRNNLGTFEGFYEDPRFAPPWMDNFNVVTQHRLLLSGLLDSGHTTKQIAICRFAGKLPIGMTGLGVDDMPYPVFDIYHVAFKDTSGAYYTNWRQVYDATQASSQPYANDLSTYPTITGSVTRGTALKAWRADPTAYGAQLLSALMLQAQFEQINGVTDSAHPAAASLANLLSAPNISVLLQSDANGAAKHALWLQGSQGARWNGVTMSIPGFTPPPPPPPPSPGAGGIVISAITHVPTGTVFAGTLVGYSATVSESLGYSIVSAQWSFTINGGSPISQGSSTTGTGLKTINFTYPNPASIGATYVWKLTVQNSNGDIATQTVTIVVSAPSPAPAPSSAVVHVLAPMLAPNGRRFFDSGAGFSTITFGRRSGPLLVLSTGQAIPMGAAIPIGSSTVLLPDGTVVPVI